MQCVLLGLARHDGEDREEIAPRQAPAHLLTGGDLLHRAGNGPKVDLPGTDQRLKVLVGDQSHVMTGRLQTDRQRQIGLDVPAAAGRDEGDFHDFRPPGSAWLAALIRVS